MPSTPQSVPTVVLFDYLKDNANNALIGERIIVTLNAPSPITAISPLVVLTTTQQQTTTDGDGYWQFSLVPNTNISPANTVYTVQTPAGTYDVTLGATGPYQSTALGTIVNVPVPLAPATTPGPVTISGNLTVTGVFAAASAAITGALSAAITTISGLLTAAAGLVVSGGTGATLNASGDLAVRSVTTSSGIGPYTPSTLAYPGGQVWGTKTVMAGAPSGVDDTAMLTALLAGGNVEVLLQEGIYITSPLTVANYTRITGTGRVTTAVKLKNGSNSAVFSNNGASYVEISHMQIDCNGANQSTDARAAVFIGGPSECSIHDLVITGATITDQLPIMLNGAGSNCVVRDVHILNCIAGVQISNGMTDCLVDHVQVTGFTSVNVANGGIAIVTNCSRTTISNCQVSGGTTHGVYVSGSDYVKILDCNLFNNLHGFGQDIRGITILTTARWGLISRCVISGNGEDGILLGTGADGCVGWTFEANIVFNNNANNNTPGGHGIELLGTDCVVVGNYINGNRSGIYVGSADTTIVANTIRANKDRGIYIFNAAALSNVIIKANQISNNSQGAGGTLSGLECNGSGGAGSITNITIVGNNCFDDQGAGATQKYGVSMTNVVGSGTVVGNVFSGNVTAGFSYTPPANPNVKIESNAGYNPVGAVSTPGFPLTTVAVTNNTGSNVLAFIVNGVNAMTIQLDAVAALMVLPASQTAVVPIPHGSSFKATYAGGAPSWVWYGN